MRICPSQFEVLVSSRTENNPCEASEKADKKRDYTLKQVSLHEQCQKFPTNFLIQNSLSDYLLEQVFGEKTSIVREYYERSFKGEEYTFESSSEAETLTVSSFGLFYFLEQDQQFITLQT